MLMLALNRNVRATNSGPKPTSAAATAPLHRHGSTGNRVTDRHVYSDRRMSNSNDFAEISTVCSLVNESVFEHGILASSSRCDINNSHAVISPTPSSSNTVTAALESHNKPTTLPPQNAAELSTSATKTQPKKIRRRKRIVGAHAERVGTEKNQTTPQCGRHCLKPGCGSSGKKKSSKIPEEMRDKITGNFGQCHTPSIDVSCYMQHDAN